MVGNEAEQALPFIAASDLRQYVYCARVVYYRYCVPVKPPPTYKMVEGKLQHERVEELEHRRSLRAYGLSDGERVFHVRMGSERLGVSGLVDMIIVRRHEVIPVEFKLTEAPAIVEKRQGWKKQRGHVAPTWVGNAGETATEEGEIGEGPAESAEVVALHHKYQLAAYAMMAEERWPVPARRCFVYFVPAKRAAEVAIGDGVRRYTRRLLREMRGMIVTQRMPEPTLHRGRCQECEYRRFCNDVD